MTLRNIYMECWLVRDLVIRRLLVMLNLRAILVPFNWGNGGDVQSLGDSPSGDRSVLFAECHEWHMHKFFAHAVFSACKRMSR